MKNLKVRERHAKIISVLRQHGSLSIAELATLLHVSDETIRRDAVPLEENGELLKMHGALALPHNMAEATFERRMREFAPAKIAIGRAAAEIVRDGESLIIDTGTTTTFFARELRQRRNLTIITNSTEIARTLADVPGNKVYLAGGEIEADSGATYGQTTTEFASRFAVKHAFLSIGGFDVTIGPMNATVLEAQFASTALRCANHRVILADSSKFIDKAFIKVCEFSEIGVIITEAPPPAEFFAAFIRSDTKLVIAS